MNRKVLIGLGVSLLVAASLVAVGGAAFRAGQRHDGFDGLGRVSELVVGEDGARTVIVADGWRGGWHGGGFGFGFPLFPLVVVGLVLLFASRRGRWGGPWRSREDEMTAWHRRAHAAEGAPISPSPPAPAPPTAPASSSAPAPPSTPSDVADDDAAPIVPPTGPPSGPPAPPPASSEGA